MSDGSYDPMAMFSPDYFNPAKSIQGLSTPMNAESFLPKNPVSPNWRNPYAYTPWGKSEGFGDYLGANAPLFMGGLQALSGGVQAYTGLQGLKLAKDAFRQQKREFNINLANQTQSYNTAVGDRITGRYYATEEERNKAMGDAQLTDRSTYGDNANPRRGRG